MAYILLTPMVFSVFSDAHTNTIPWVSDDSPLQYTTDGYPYLLNTEWNNKTFTNWNYSSQYEYWEYLLLNDGTEDIWVNILVDINETLNDTMQTYYLTIDIFQDRDMSVLEEWEENIDLFSAVNWQGYQDDYWEEYGDGWGEFQDDWDFGDEPTEPSPATTSPEDPTTTEEEDLTGPGDNWDIYLDDQEDFSDYTEAYARLREDLSGDESFWFVNLYFEEWNRDYTGSSTFTWYDSETGEIIDPMVIDWEPVQFYEWDLDIAQEMMQNQSGIAYTDSWSWFSYDIQEWVTWFDPLAESLDFVTTEIAYTGMNIFEDLNGNNIADEFYTYDPETGYYGYDSNASEIRYYVEIESLQDITWGYSDDPDDLASDEDVIFWVSLHDVNLTAYPYGDDRNLFDEPWMETVMDDTSNPISPISSYTSTYNISFTYGNTPNSTSLAVKHDLGPMMNTSNPSLPLDVFDGLGLTFNYAITSSQFSDLYTLDETIKSPEIYEAIENDGEFAAGTDDIPIMEFDFAMNYTVGEGEDEEVFDNYVSLNPASSYGQNYDTADMGVTSLFESKIAPYAYSMCFPEWGGQELHMDPKFVSYFSAPPSVPISLFLKILLVVFLPLALSFGLIMSKQEYRSYLLNRVMILQTGAHRLNMEQVLENENRSKIIDLILEEPGIHYSELLRQTDLAPGNLTWHLEILDRYKIIKNEVVGKYVVYFPYYGKNPLSAIDLKLRKSRTTMEILELIQDKPGLSQNKIAKEIEKNHKTVKYHLDKLYEADLIEKRQEGGRKFIYATIPLSPDVAEE